MTAIWIWLGALLLYASFRLWYDGWRGALTAAEIEDFMRRLAALSLGRPDDEVARLRRFLEEDDGREFVMLNLVRLPTEKVPHPRTGEPWAARDLLAQYTNRFIPALVRRGGHPAIIAAKVGGYLDTWNVEDDPGWTVVGFMRYRSRRDMMELVVDPRFAPAHAFKVAATAVTLSFPTSPRLMVFCGPRVWVGLLVALGAALVHLSALAWR